MKTIIYRYHLMSIFCMLLVLIFFYFPILFLGRTLQGPEMLRMNPYLKSAPSPESILSAKIPPQIFNAEQNTAGNAKFPNDIFMGSAYRAGKIPLWNSHQGIGIPFAGQYETSAFFPLRILQNLFPPSSRDWFYIFYLWAAGIFSYCFFMQTTDADRDTAFWGAVLYMGSGVFSWFIQVEEFTSVALTLPLLMLATYQLSLYYSKKRIVFLSIVTAVMLTAGQPEAIFYAFVLSGCYYIFKLSSTNKAIKVRLINLSGFIFATTLGFLLASPLLLLFHQLYQNGSSFHASNNLMGIVTRTPLALLPGIIFPNLITIPTMPITLPFPQYWEYLGGYIGIIALFFIIAGCLVKNESLKKDFVFFIIFSSVFLLMNLGIAPFSWIGYLPLFRQAWSPRWGGAAWSFSLIIATTYGYHIVKQYASHCSNHQLKALLKHSLLILTIIIVICFIPTASHLNLLYYGNEWTFIVNNLNQPWTRIFTSFFFTIASIGTLIYILYKHRSKKYCWNSCTFVLIISLWYFLPKGNFIFPIFSSYLSQTNNFLLTQLLSLILALFLLVAVMLYVQQKIIQSIMLAVLIFITSIIYGQYALPGYPKYVAMEKPMPFIQFLEKNAGYDRLFGFNDILTPSYASIYGLYDIRFTIAVNIDTYQHFLVNYIKKQHLFPQWFDANFFLTTSSMHYLNHALLFKNDFPKALDLLSVKYLIAPENANRLWLDTNYPNLSKQLIQAYHDNFVTIYKNVNVLPRTFIVDHYEFANSYQTAQSIAMQSNFNLLKAAILEKTIPNTHHDTVLNATSQIQQYTDEKIIINTHSNKPALLILTDIDYPGWQASIDGKTTDIVRADGLMRGVFIPAGDHTVTFYYFPRIFKLGLMLMIGALIICSTLLVFG